MNTSHTLPDTVAASLEARLAPFHRAASRPALEDLDVETSVAVAPGEEPRFRHSLFSDLKLLFAALSAGSSAVPMGDNRRSARLLSAYAASLRDH